VWEGEYANIAKQYLYLSPETCLLRLSTQSFTGGECMEHKVMSILFQPTRLVGAIAIAMGCSPAIFAEDTTISAQLDPIVVTASKSAEKASEVPARITIIKPEIIEQSSIASLPQLLQTDASINVVQTGGYGQYSEIYLRGTKSSQALILRDGVRLNSNTSGQASLPFIDTTDVKQIEVLKGPASVLYGTDAIGGVIQIISTTPEKNSAFITGEVGENKTYKSVIGADLADNGFYAQIRGQRLETDGTPVTNAKNNKRASFDQKGYSLKVGIEKDIYATSLDYSKNQGNSDYDQNSNLVSQDFENEIVNFKSRLNISEQVAIHTRLSQFKDNIDQNNSPDYVHSTTQEAELYTKWQFSPSQNILTGISHKNIKANIFSKGEGYEWDGVYYPGQDVFYNKDVKTTGYFVQHQYQTDILNTQAGIRLEDHERFGNHTVGQIAARYFLSPSTSIYTNIGSAFKAPTNNDLYAIGWGANPNLEPEKSISYELGFDHQLTQQLSAGFSVYQTQIDDLISSRGSQLINIDKAKLTGSEATINWQKDELFLNMAYAYIQAKNDITKKDLNRRPRQNITLTAGWDDRIYGLSASVIAKSKAKDFSESTIPGYITANINAYWQLTPTVKLFTNIENIGDVEYKTAYNGNNIYYVNGGRLASAGVTFRY